MQSPKCHGECHVKLGGDMATKTPRRTGEALLLPNELKGIAPDAHRDIYLKDGGGLYARVLAGYDKGDKKIYFVWRYSLRGRKQWLPLGVWPEMTLQEAREARHAARKLAKGGTDPLAERKRLEAEEKARQAADAAEKTVRGLFEDWSKRYLQKQRSPGKAGGWKDGGKLARQFIESDVLQYIGDAKLKHLTRKQITECLDRITDREANRKANMVLSLLKQMLDWGVSKGDIEANPIASVRRRDIGGIEVERKRNLSADEIAELAKRLPDAKLPERVQIAVWLLLATGARVGELTQASWPEFDLKGRIWTIPEAHSKNGKAHVVHLSDFALAQLTRLRELSPGALLFEGRKDGKSLDAKQIGKFTRDRQRKKPLKKRTRQTGTLALPRGEWRIHDLRRTMASRMGELEIAPNVTIPPQVIEKCLNHKLEGILAVYQQQEMMAQRQQAFDLWGAKLSILATGVNPDKKPEKKPESAGAKVLPMKRNARAA